MKADFDIRLIDTCILDPKIKNTMVLVFQKKLTIEETAELTESSVATVKRRITQGIATIQEISNNNKNTTSKED